MPGSLTPAYTLTARILHWTTVVLIAFMIPAGILTVFLFALRRFLSQLRMFREDQ